MPLLAIEVLSPSTRLVDLDLKFARYQAAGCPNYWVADPDTPSITAWRLADDRYLRVAEAAADDDFAVDSPYPVNLSPRQLLD